MNTTVAIIVAIGGVASAILAIWALLEKVTKKFERVLENRIKEAIRESKDETRKDMELILEAHRDAVHHRIDSVKSEVKYLGEESRRSDLEHEELLKTQSKAILEGYKHDIRQVYYKLRSSGLITDIDKTFVDKIYHYYKELGGNSDIDSKYKEMCEVYSRRTHEKYDERANKSKKR